MDLKDWIIPFKPYPMVSFLGLDILAKAYDKGWLKGPLIPDSCPDKLIWTGDAWEWIDRNGKIVKGSSPPP